MTPRQADVIVIGAGVSGLTTAVCLADAGYSVRVRATRLPPETTSCSAGALWGPYLVADERVLSWCQETRRVMEGLAGEETGIRITAGIEAAKTTVDPPAWAHLLDGFAICGPDELPDGYVTGWRYTAPVVDMPAYLDYLTRRLLETGRGTVEVGQVESLAEAAAWSGIAVNCTGYGARHLVPDPEVTPVRGQLLVVDNPGIERFFAEAEVEIEGADPTELTYIFPQGDHVVLGGTAVTGRHDVTDDPTAAAGILRRCAAVEPALAGARIRAGRAGIRPSRPRVRVERVEVERAYLIHNYGHGGSGVTLSWGCAAEVLRLVREIATEPGPVPNAAPGPDGGAVVTRPNR
ncbi:FAD-dependent oxidoreductase [Phytohabitans kaempferiae]|uniref:D-amino-acid oxidase n=1 Tax=Phytohabitans kaempferiae TaxID=1620943 RepID=A0ABV6M7U2_9ACTN